MPSLERTLVRQFEMPGETDRVSLDRMCSSYGFVASKFLFAFQTRELRGEVRDFRAFRNRLVAALGKKPVEFNHKLADLRTNGKAAEASLLTLSELLGVAYTQIRNPDSNLSLLGRS